MASVSKRPRSPFWWASYYREDGRRAQRSTKTRDRKEAQRIADELESAHRQRATEAQMRRILSSLNERLVGQPLQSATLADYAKGWLAEREREIERVSFLAYKGAVDAFVASLPNKAGMGLQYVSPADVAAYRDACAKRATAKTANNKLKVLRSMFQTAWRDGYIPENPAAKVKTLETAESARRPFTLPELKRAFDVAGPEWRGMILVGLYTGQRLKDVSLLRWSNVDVARSLISLKTSKTGRNQEIPIAAPLLEYFTALPAPDEPGAYIFPAAAALVDRDGDVGRLSQQFYDLLSLAGLVKPRTVKEKAEGKGIGRDGKRERNGLSFHSLRHTATSLLKNAGVSEAVTRDIIGHDSAVVSRHYTHIEIAPKRAALSLLPDVTTATDGGGYEK